MISWPRATTTRLALAVSALFLLAMVVLGAGVYFTTSTLLTNDLREVIRDDSQGLLDLYQNNGMTDLVQEVSDRTDSPVDPNAVYAVVAPNGELLAGRFAQLPAHIANGKGWVGLQEHGEGGDYQVIAYVEPLAHGGHLLTGLRTNTQQRFLELMLRTALLGLVAAASLGLLVGWLTARLVARRLESAYDTARRVGEGELALRAPVDGSDDAFDRLARRLNAMLDRIQELLDGVRHATDHIAHDLRTPLTRLRNRLEEIRARAVADPALSPLLEPAIAETDQLLETFSALLRLARIEAQPSAVGQPVLALDALVFDAVELYAPIAAERGIVLHTDVQPTVVHGDPDQLFQLVANLLDNALKYGPPGSRVEVTLRSEGGAASLGVADQGPGIPEADRERVFDRFVRLETHRSSPGTGLGLALVRAIAFRHGASVALEPSEPGLRVRVRMPRRTAAYPD